MFTLGGVKQSEEGQSILEVLIALAIVSLVVLAVSATSAIVLNGHANNTKKLQQQALLRGAMDQLDSIAKRDWNALYSPDNSSMPGSGDVFALKNPTVDDDSGSTEWALYKTSNFEGRSLTISNFVYNQKIRIDEVKRDGNGNVSDQGSVDPDSVKITVTISAPGLADVSDTRIFSRKSVSICIQDEWDGISLGNEQCPATSYAYAMNLNLPEVINWAQDAPATTWEARAKHTMLSFNNKLWIMGGMIGNVANNDFDEDDNIYLGKNAAGTSTTWSSADGINWVPGGPIGLDTRYGHAAVVFNNAMWVMGGYSGSTGSGYLNSVLRSTDGISWSNVGTVSSSFSSIDGAAASFNGKIWLFGGRQSIEYGYGSREIWSSSDGINWSRNTNNAPWGQRSGHAVAEYNGALYLTGGFSNFVDGTLHHFRNGNDVWRSFDGFNWTKITDNAGWLPRSEHSSVVYDGKLWIIGGNVDGGVADTWWTTNGVNWQKANQPAPFGDRFGHESAVLNGKIWLTGGIVKGAGEELLEKNDVWSATAESGVNAARVKLKAGQTSGELESSVIDLGKRLSPLGIQWEGIK